MIYVRQKHSLTHLEDSTVTFHDHVRLNCVRFRNTFGRTYDRRRRERKLTPWEARRKREESAESAIMSCLRANRIPSFLSLSLHLSKKVSKRIDRHEIHGTSRNQERHRLRGIRSAVNQPGMSTEKFNTNRSIRIQWPGL